AVRFVVGDEIVAKRAARQIEGRGDVFRLVLVQQLAEHRDEDVDRVGGASLRVAEEPALVRAHRRVKRAVHLRAAVNEIERQTFYYIIEADAPSVVSQRSVRTWRSGVRLRRRRRVPAV